MSWNEGFSGGNRSINVLDCGAHRSDNLTPYAPPAKLRALASALHSASHRPRKYGARHRAAGARSAYRRDGLQHLRLESSDAVVRTESAGEGVLTSRGDTGSRHRW